MTPFLSEGDFWGDLQFPLFLLLISSFWSVIPTKTIVFWVVNFDGLILSRFTVDSFTFPSISKDNCNRKPPWIITYISVGIFQALFSSISVFYLRICLLKSFRIMSDNVRKSLQDLNLGINDTPISLPSELCGRATTINRFSLIVTVVNPRKQNLRAIANQMPRIWGFADSCRGRILGNGKVLFIFQTEESLNLVLRRGPWAFNDWMISVHRWYPNITEEEMKIIPFWIQIRGIPILYLTEAMVRYVRTQLGQVANVDFDENAAATAEFARVCMNWNFDMPLRFQRNFQFAVDENTILKFRFERLRNFCTKCGSLKHDAKECSLEFEDPPMDDSDDDNDPVDHQPPQVNASDPAVTLPTIATDVEIPGLGKTKAHTEFIITESSESSLPSAFEDVELTAERLHYLYNKFARGKDQVGIPNTVSPIAEADNNGFYFNKRKRSEWEVYYQQREEEEDLTVLSQIRKKEKTESQGSTSGIKMDRGAGGPVPPHPP